MADTCSLHSSNISLDLEEEDRRYLEALQDRDHIATKSTRHPLGLFSVVAFILQQVIGTGIFRTPWTVMQATQSIGVTLLFWLLGALTALAGTVLYIEFGLTIPRHLINGKFEPVVRNGGDMNYVSYLIKRPKFLIHCFYALNFILLASSAANALSFGDDIVGGQSTDRSAAQDASARGLAIVAVTFPCLLHAFTRRGGIILNNIVVICKVLILCAFPVMAICVLCGVTESNYAKENMSASASFANVHGDVDSYTQGVLAVLYAYSGYNQANYVLCEIHRPRKNFVKGIIIATSIICVLYMLVNLSYMIVFLINVIGERRAPHVLSTFSTVSSLGNIIGMTFTASKVKQEIAKEGVIPFAKFFGENRSLIRRGDQGDGESRNSEPTSLGALFLHWFFAIFLIVVTWFTRPAYAYRILVNLYAYTTDVVPSFIMAIGMLYLRFFTTWSSKSPMPSWLSIIAGSIYALANGFPLFAVWIPPMRNFEVHDIIPGFPWYMTGLLTWSLLVCGVVYWFSFRFVLPRFGARKGKEFAVEREPVFRTENGERVQWHEIVLHSWVVKGEPEGREGYVLDDI